MEYKLAVKISENIQSQLQPFSEICLIAGSIRRKKSECGDIEIVLLRKMKHLFEFSDLVNKWYAVKGTPIGRYTQRIVTINNEGYTLDLFMPIKEDFYRQYAIRTGSSDFSQKVLATAWVKKGWRGTENGLRLESECIKKSDKFICNKSNPTLPPVWESEKHFFEWLEIKYVEPENRK